MRKYRGSASASALDAQAIKSKLAQARPRQLDPIRHHSRVLPGETFIGNDTMPAKRLQPAIGLD
jgi:hypothetical protein